MLALDSQHYGLVRWLLQLQGIDTNLASEFNITALHTACQVNFALLLYWTTYILVAGNAGPPSGYSGTASQTLQVSSAITVVSLFPNVLSWETVNKQDCIGNTALDVAVMTNKAIFSNVDVR